MTLSHSAPLVALLFTAGTVAGIGTGCRSRTTGPSTEELAGIGFQLEGDPHVARGTILTQPRGREEAFLTLVVGNVPRWVTACLHEPGRSPLVFSFKTDQRGGVQTAPPPSNAPAQARCIAARAGEVPAPTGGKDDAKPLPAQTEVTVQVLLNPRD